MGNVGLFEKNVKFNLEFNEKPILFREIKTSACERPLSKKFREMWQEREEGDVGMSDIYLRLEGRLVGFNNNFIYSNKVSPTLIASGNSILFDEPRYRNKEEIILCSTFPLDYDFLNQQPHYICGMSVPPLMIAKISNEVYKQFLSKL
ncbi:MAG: hypothetical protein U0O22_00955 [Acutalibacteraceae bacterium]